MALPTCFSGSVLIAVFLVAQISEARDIPRVKLPDAMPQSCSTSDYCNEKHEDYPQKEIDELLNKTDLTLISDHVESRPRFGEAGQCDINYCDKNETYELIYEIIDEDGHLRVVVQSETLFKQQFRIEWCLYPKRLFQGQYFKQFFYCEDTKIDYYFLVLTRDGRGMEFVKSRSGIPVYCACRLNF